MKVIRIQGSAGKGRKFDDLERKAWESVPAEDVRGKRGPGAGVSLVRYKHEDRNCALEKNARQR